MAPVFFATPADFRTWLAAHHTTARELWVGFHKVDSGRPSITWPESVDEALCFGWIDGIRKRIDDTSYMIRFTPRKPGSNWSAKNIARVAELAAMGRMEPAGTAAFAARTEDKSGVYSYEQRHLAALDAAEEDRFRAEPAAWTYFQAQPAWYRRAAIHWVVSAKQPATREKRLATLIADSAASRPIAPMARHPKSG